MAKKVVNLGEESGSVAITNPTQPIDKKSRKKREPNKETKPRRTPRTEHHARMDELLKNFGEKCHEELDKALKNQGIDAAYFNPEEFTLAKMVITIVGEGKHFYPLFGENKKLLANLRHFIG